MSTCPRQEEERLLQIVRKGRFEFSSPYWDDISDEAKQLVSDCLQLDPARRPTAEMAASYVLNDVGEVPAVVHQYSKGAAGRKLQRTKFYERYLSVAT